MGLQLVTAPASLALDLAVAKSHLRIEQDDTFQDEEVTRFIKSATTQVQGITQRALMPQTWKLTLDYFPCAIKIPLPPLKEVVSIKYLDESGDQQTLPPSSYVVSASCLIGKVSQAYGYSWPATLPQADAVEVEFTAGYDEVPDDIVSALLLLIGQLDQNREAVIVGTISTELPFGVDALLAPYTVPSTP